MGHNLGWKTGLLGGMQDWKYHVSLVFPRERGTQDSRNCISPPRCLSTSRLYRCGCVGGWVGELYQTEVLVRSQSVLRLYSATVKCSEDH
jgi:hypothetical protein